MTTLKWSDYYYKQVGISGSVGDFNSAIIDGISIDVDTPFTLVDPHDELPIELFIGSVVKIYSWTSGACRPQLAYHAFAASRRSSYMDGYFPITKSLSKDALRQFHEVIRKVMLHPGFNVRLLDKRQLNHIEELPAIGYLVAGHMVEMLFYRQDILDRLLEGTVRIWLYTDKVAFTADKGVAGGCYNLQKGCLQLVLSRLFEGFSQPAPGVAPFLHEFGHLLDFYDTGALKATDKSSGWLPGMRSSDGEIYTPEARNAFIKGKRLEMDRYERQVARPDGTEPLPIGHPYVFQNNSEFVAGYLEMFFRNPHYFAAQNPMLYSSFHMLFRQDPRDYWEADFPFYIQQNRAFYQSGQRPRAHGLTLDSS